MIKLLKYELKQTWKMCATLIMITLFGCIGMIFNPFNGHSIMFPLYMMLCGLVVVGSTVSLFFYCMGSFNQEFTRPQGYLIMTLPIKARDFIWAKFISQGMWNVLGGLIITGTFSFFLKNHLGSKMTLQGMDRPTLIQSSMNGISSYILTVFIIYFSIVLLSRQPADNHYNFIKVILSIVLSYSISVLIGLISIFIPYSLKYGIPTSIGHIEQLVYYLQNNADSLNILNIIMNLVVACILYLVTESMIDKKVQL